MSGCHGHMFVFPYTVVTAMVKYSLIPIPLSAHTGSDKSWAPVSDESRGQGGDWAPVSDESQGQGGDWAPVSHESRGQGGGSGRRPREEAQGGSY